MAQANVNSELSIIDYCLDAYQSFLAKAAINNSDTTITNKATCLFHMINSIRACIKLLVGESHQLSDDVSRLIAYGLTQCLPNYTVTCHGNVVSKKTFYMKGLPTDNPPHNHYLLTWHKANMPEWYDDHLFDYVTKFLHPTFIKLYPNWNKHNDPMLKLLLHMFDILMYFATFNQVYADRLVPLINQFNKLSQHTNMQVHITLST